VLYKFTFDIDIDIDIWHKYNLTMQNTAKSNCSGSVTLDDGQEMRNNTGDHMVTHDDTVFVMSEQLVNPFIPDLSLADVLDMSELRHCSYVSHYVHVVAVLFVLHIMV